jgi:hypothetical protein
MTEESNIEDVAQSENNEVRSLTEEPPSTIEEAIGDADTAEGQARRAEEAHFGEVEADKVAEGEFTEAVKEFEGWLDSQLEDLEEEVEDLPPLPTTKEAEMGELCRVPSEGQFEECELLEDDDGDLIEFITEGDVNDTTEGGILEEIENEVLEITGGEN